MAAAAAGLARDSTVPDASSRRGADRFDSPRSIVVGRGVLTAPQSHPNESFVFKRLRGATPNRPHNRFQGHPTPNCRVATPNCRTQKSATLSLFSRRRGERKAHHNAATRGLPTPPRPFNPRPLQGKRKTTPEHTTYDASRAAPCGHFASLVRSTFGLRGYPPIFDLRRINQAASVSHIPLAVRRARRAGYRGCVSRKRRGRTWRRTQVANATREKRPF